MPTTTLAYRVYNELRRHMGRRNAITGSQLAAALGQPDDRAVRIAIRDLVREGVAIASSVSSPPGYYICASRDEAVAYMESLRARIQEDQGRLRDFEEAAAASFEIPQQGELL